MNNMTFGKPTYNLEACTILCCLGKTPYLELLILLLHTRIFICRCKGNWNNWYYTCLCSIQEF